MEFRHPSEILWDSFEKRPGTMKLAGQAAIFTPVKSSFRGKKERFMGSSPGDKHMQL